MELMAAERAALERYMPGLDQALAEIPLPTLESRGSPGIGLFRDAGGVALLIPKEQEGHGADAVESIRVQRAIGSRSPSLAIAATMHHFSVATLVELAAQSGGMEWMLLQAIAQQKLLVSSGFAEGNTGSGILGATMKAARVEGGYTVNGVKKPCSLTYSMDLLTASVLLPAETGEGTELAVLLIPSKSPGIERRDFWGSWVLAGAESDEVILTDVMVPDRLVFRAGGTQDLDPVQISGFLWFELLITASYLGAASALVERAVKARKGEPADRVRLGIEVEGAMTMLEGVARSMMAGQRDDAELAQMLFVRYAVQGAIERATALAVELLGGMAFIGSSDVAYLYAAARALAFHPPGRTAMSGALEKFMTGESLRIQ